MTTVSENIHLSILERDYILLSELSEFMKESSQFPYKSRFSFSPYERAMKTRLHDACEFTKSALNPILGQYSKFIESDEFDLEVMKKDPKFRAMVSLVVPTMLLNDSLNFIATPFSKDILISTDKFKEFYSGDKWEIKVIPEKILDTNHVEIRDLFIYILNKYYDQKITDNTSETFIIRDKETEIERYYQFKMHLDFIDVELKMELPELNQSQINKLLKNTTDIDILTATFPPEMFEFYGFMVGSLVDVTDTEVIGELRMYLNGIGDSFDAFKFHSKLEGYLKSFLNKTDVRVGEIILDKRNFHTFKSLSLTGLKGESFMQLDPKYIGEGGLYHALLKNKKTVSCENIEVIKGKFPLEDKLLNKGYKSVILHPIVDSFGKIRNIIEVASKDSMSFNALTVKKIESVFVILDSSYLQFLDFLERKISDVIKDAFTSIHPSVEWKFKEAATKYYNEKIQGREIDMPIIEFEGLYPLYGQSDIVASSIARSKAVINDLAKNLKLLDELMTKWLSKKKIYILESYHLKVKNKIEKLKTEFETRDETDIIKKITKEIHPLIKQLAERHSELSKKDYTNYMSQMDPVYGTYYVERKAFEESMSIINTTISKFLDEEDEKMQLILPHYFEKYKTDGIEYNIYLGQSLLKNGKFSKYDLRNFKIWQLNNMCEIVRLVDKVTPELSVPLKTAQLIFVYNHSLSILFRMDEKKFDVEGAYNVRYEIIKKRIDKATVKGTGERLTLAGKIAIVYLNNSDKTEYMEYIHDLLARGFITDDIEDLELDNLQGVDGLRALRVTVI